MEQQQLQLPQDYKKGFNDAWRLSESMPQLFNGLKLPEGKNDDYTKGFDDGRKEFVKERHLEQIKQRRTQNKDRGQSR